MLLTEESVGHVQTLVAKHGTDCWWTMPPEELLAPKYRHDGSVPIVIWTLLLVLTWFYSRKIGVEWVPGRDTMDVWLDSGASWQAVLARRGVALPADLYLEGSDQHRGWFQSSLITSGFSISFPKPFFSTVSFTLTIACVQLRLMVQRPTRH